MSQDFLDVVEIKNGFAYQSILSVLSINFFCSKMQTTPWGKKENI